MTKTQKRIVQVTEDDSNEVNWPVVIGIIVSMIAIVLVMNFA